MKPVTKTGQVVRVTDDPNAQFYVMVPRYGFGPSLVPRKDTDDMIAVFDRGMIKNVLFSSLVPTLGIVAVKVCECGADKHGFASHSGWCPKS